MAATNEEEDVQSRDPPKYNLTVGSPQGQRQMCEWASRKTKMLVPRKISGDKITGKIESRYKVMDLYSLK